MRNIQTRIEDAAAILIVGCGLVFAALMVALIAVL
jgi:hypothetical protein